MEHWWNDTGKSAPKYYDNNRSFATSVSQLKMCEFSGETFKVLKCYNFP